MNRGKAGCKRPRRVRPRRVLLCSTVCLSACLSVCLRDSAPQKKKNEKTNRKMKHQVSTAFSLPCSAEEQSEKRTSIDCSIGPRQGARSTSSKVTSQDSVCRQHARKPASSEKQTRAAIISLARPPSTLSSLHRLIAFGLARATTRPLARVQVCVASVSSSLTVNP